MAPVVPSSSPSPPAPTAAIPLLPNKLFSVEVLFSRIRITVSPTRLRRLEIELILPEEICVPAAADAGRDGVAISPANLRMSLDNCRYSQTMFLFRQPVQIGLISSHFFFLLLQLMQPDFDRLTFTFALALCCALPSIASALSSILQCLLLCSALL